MNALSVLGKEYDSSSDEEVIQNEKKKSKPSTTTIKIKVQKTSNILNYHSLDKTNNEQSTCTKKLKLPSAQSLFESTLIPSFVHKRKNNDPVENLIFKVKTEEQRKKKQAMETNNKDYVPSQDQDIEKNVDLMFRIKEKKIVSKPRIQDKLDNKKNNDMNTIGKRNKGKERVKAQRLKGQAGIGSDYRTWKSETEMSLRQQFD